MWKKASSCTFLLAVLVACVSAQNAATNNDVLLTVPVTIDGSLKNLHLMRGESVEDAAASFVLKNAQQASDATRVREMIDQLSGLLRGHMQEMRTEEPPKPTVQVTMPLTVAGVSRELQKMEGESVEAAVERFLYDGGYSMDVMRELYPQLVQILVQKLEDLKPARKQVFAFDLSIDGRAATARHFENGDPMEEARETLRSVNINDAAMVDRMAPQIAAEIRKQIEATQPPAPPVQQAPQPPQPPAPAKELFSIPLTVNERPTVLVHYEGYTSRESATRYLNENGLTGDQATQLMGQVIQIIDTRIAEIARDQAAQEAATRAAAEEAAARAKAEEEAAARAAAAQRQPTVRLPINFGDNQVATLEYFEGDSIERTVELFLTQIGMQESSTFTQNVGALSDAVRQEMKNVVAKREAEVAQAAASSPLQEQQPPPADPLVQLPVTLSGRVFDLFYFEGEEPATVANAFCVEKHEIIRAEMGLQFDGDQLVECKRLLDSTLRNLITQKLQQRELKQQEEQATQQQQQPEQVPQQQQQPEPVAQPQAQAPQQPRSRGEVLFSLDIEIDNENVPLTMHQNDEPEQVARAFCEQHKVDLSNVAPLVRALNEQLAQLK